MPITVALTHDCGQSFILGLLDRELRSVIVACPSCGKRGRLTQANLLDLCDRYAVIRQRLDAQGRDAFRRQLYDALPGH